DVLSGAIARRDVAFWIRQTENDGRTRHRDALNPAVPQRPLNVARDLWGDLAVAEIRVGLVNAFNHDDTVRRIAREFQRRLRIRDATIRRNASGEAMTLGREQRQ